MMPQTKSFIEDLVRDLLFCGISGWVLWLNVCRRDVWMRIVDNDAARQRRMRMPQKFIELSRRFGAGKGFAVIFSVCLAVGAISAMLDIYWYVTK